MAAPHGTCVDINIIIRDLGILKKLCQRNIIAAGQSLPDDPLAEDLSATILTNVTALNVLIQAASDNQDLNADPTLA